MEQDRSRPSVLTRTQGSFFLVFSACATRARVWGPSIALQNATRALQPTEALKQARLRHLAWVATFPSKDPIEVRSGRHDRLPQTAKPSKMKP